MRPQDIVVLLAIVSIRRQGWDKKGDSMMNMVLQNKYLSNLLNISIGEISQSIYRSSFSRLIEENFFKKVFMQSLFEFIVYGLKYVFPAQPGALVRGIPTAHSASPLKNILTFQEEVVWEHPEGTVRGQAIIPLYSTVPEIVKNNELLYELLALTDSLRIGGARERELAIIELEKRFFQ